MAKARDLLGKSGAGGFVPPPQTKKLDLTVPEETDGEQKQDTKRQPEKGALPKAQTKGGGGAPTSVRPKV
jgi:hypothetical protein